MHKFLKIIGKPASFLGDKVSDTLTQQAIKSIVGKAAVLLGAWLAHQGYIEGSSVEAVTGALVVILTSAARAAKAKAEEAK